MVLVAILKVCLNTLGGGGSLRLFEGGLRGQTVFLLMQRCYLYFSFSLFDTSKVGLARSYKTCDIPADKTAEAVVRTSRPLSSRT